MLNDSTMRQPACLQRKCSRLCCACSSSLSSVASPPPSPLLGYDIKRMSLKPSLFLYCFLYFMLLRHPDAKRSGLGGLTTLRSHDGTCSWKENNKPAMSKLGGPLNGGFLVQRGRRDQPNLDSSLGDVRKGNVPTELEATRSK